MVICSGLVRATFRQEAIRFCEPTLSLYAEPLLREGRQQGFPTREFRLLQSPT